MFETIYLRTFCVQYNTINYGTINFGTIIGENIKNKVHVIIGILTINVLLINVKIKRYFFLPMNQYK